MSRPKWYPSQIALALKSVGRGMRTSRLQKKIRSHPDRYYLRGSRKNVMARVMQFRMPVEMLYEEAMRGDALMNLIPKNESWKGGYIQVPLVLP